MSTPTAGIAAMGVYCGVARITVREIFRGRGLDESRYANLLMRQRSVQMPWEDPVSNAVNAARPVVDALSEEERAGIGLLITSTESGLDFSKSVASYVHRYLGLSRNCRFMEVKQACYGATGALQLAAGYVASGIDPGRTALVVATDVNPMDEAAGYAEPATGHGAVALLVGSRPDVLSLDLGAYGAYGFDVLDTARPAPDFDLYHPDLSLLTYLECYAKSFEDYRRRVGDAEVSYATSFDLLAMHSPFGGMVKAAHRKMMRACGTGSPAHIAADFARRVEPSLSFVRDVGNLCSGSVYLALAGLASETGPAAGGARVGLFAYGSGCCSEFYSGVLGPGAHTAVDALGLPGALAARRPLSFEEYTRLLPAARECLVARREHRADFSQWDATVPAGRQPMLVLSHIEEHHRAYEWR